MKKQFTWAIFCPTYGHQCDLQAATGADAIAKAEALFVQAMDWQDEITGTVDTSTGRLFVRSPIPDYTAKRVRGIA